MSKKKRTIVTVSLVISAMIFTAACAPEPQPEPVPQIEAPGAPVSSNSSAQNGKLVPASDADIERLDARQRLEDQLIDTDGVLGVASSGDGFMVFVAGVTPEIEETVPSEFEGYGVRVEVTGELSAPSEGPSSPVGAPQSVIDPSERDNPGTVDPPVPVNPISNVPDSEPSILPAHGQDQTAPSPNNGEDNMGTNVEPPDDLSLGEIGEAMNRLAPTVMDMHGVSGVGVGECDGAPCIVVFVENATPELQQAIPADFEGYTVRLQEGGPFTAQ